MQTRSRSHTHSNAHIALSNIRGLNRNINSVHHFLQSQSPLILFLTETQLSPSSDTTHLQFPNYFLHHSFRFKGGVCAYVHNSVAASRLPHFDHISSDFQLLWLKLSLPQSNHYFCLLYRSPNSVDASLFDVLSLAIESTLVSDPSAHVSVLGDFNIHNSEWLLHSAGTTALGREAEAFAIINNLSQLVDFPTRVPDRDGDRAHTLDLVLTTNPTLFSNVSSLPPLGSSDHCMISCSLEFSYPTPTQP